MATTGRCSAASSVIFPSSSCLSCKPKYASSISMMMLNTIVTTHRNMACSALQESSASTVATTQVKEKKEAKPKPPAKAPAKPLPQMMEEDVIPSLQSILQTQHDISQIDLSFGDNRLDGSFVKNNISYSFWAFFPDGVLTGKLPAGTPSVNKVLFTTTYRLSLCHSYFSRTKRVFFIILRVPSEHT
ncbi:hypothetical protein AgCh_004485 [Apium graveolens]